MPKVGLEVTKTNRNEVTKICMQSVLTDIYQYILLGLNKVLYNNYIALDIGPFVGTITEGEGDGEGTVRR